MKLSLIFELLMIFVLLAFAASKNIRKQKNNNKKGIQNRNEEDIKIEENGINRFCKCSEAQCNCCRDFQVPLVNLDGPGCASLRYISGDKMSVSLSFGKKVITNRTLSGKKPTPVCMPLPGGISKFCGRVYNIARVGEEFRACLGLELQAKSTVEAAVRVSCFKFGPRGVTSEPADPLPLVPQSEKVGDDDEDDDDDDDDDDEDDDDDDFGLGDDDDDDDGLGANDVGGADYTGFSLLGDDLLGGLFGSSDKKGNKNKNKKKQAPAPSTTTTTTTRRPRPSRRPTRRPATRSTTPKLTKITTVRVRPNGTRRPSRRPTRPQRRRTTTTPAPITDISYTSKSPITPPAIGLTSAELQNTVYDQISSSNFHSSEHVVEVTPKFVPVEVTTSKPVTNFADPGLELSLASITGQLSSMPDTPMLPSRDSDVITSPDGSIYEKIETITPKMTTMSFYTTSRKADDIVKIVDSLDSNSSEKNEEQMKAEESRGQTYQIFSLPGDVQEDPNKKKKKRGGGIGLEDLDVLGLTEIGETIGENIGVFGKKRGNNKNKNQNKEINGGRGKKNNDDLVDILGITALTDSIANLSNDDNNKNKNKNKTRSRQNKMMRGEWSQRRV